MNLYIVIRDQVEDLVKDLAKHRNTSDHFYNVRSYDRDKTHYNKLSQVQRASRIHYLNKTCYNGLFRVNQAGEFNSPFGRYANPNIKNEVTLRAVSSYFNKVDIKFLCCDFEKSLNGVKKGDFVYIDPPYDPISNRSNFTGYARSGFNRIEQERLKKLCDRLDNKGVKFLLSNSKTDFILNLYKEYNKTIIQAKRVINSKPEKRGEINEVLIKNYD